MKTLISELRATIVRHVEIADQRDLLTITTALCAHEAANDAPRAPRPYSIDRRFEVLGDVVRDHETKREWTRGNVGDDMDWNAAKEACEKLDRDGGGWRLPTIKELLTLVDHERKEPAIDPVFECKPSWYWTSTPYAPHSGYAWVVNFYSGNANGLHHDYYGFVRAVRGGQF